MVSIVHPNFIRVRGWHVQDHPKKRAGIAREYINGPNLTETVKWRILQGKRLTEAECLHQFVQVALALKEFHD
jgi:hypothetical protein